jgi:uncharacterized membrane protein YedE/YeeE
MTRIASAFLAGALFGVGLGVGGLTEPARILGFLDVAGHWDPTLAFVMAGAVAVYGLAFRLIQRRRRPVLEPAFSVPPRRPVDGRLLAGAALFGLGWGAAGYCPGPALVSLATGAPPVAVFVVAMLAGIKLADAAPAPTTAGRAAAPLRTREGAV